MKIIDGSLGEGGGQVFRTSLTLAMCLGQPVTIKNIRAGRKKPGLLRQHLTCLKAAQKICDAKVKGANLGSSLVEFIPGKVSSGKFHFAVGSAGSTTLVFQTVYLPLLLADGDSELLLEGGTHNGMAPSFDFLQHAFLPELKKMNICIGADLERYGFYPAGGGAWTATIGSTDEMAPYENENRGELLSVKAVATSAQIPGHVVDRELRRVAETLTLTNEAQINEAQINEAKVNEAKVNEAQTKLELNKRIVKSVGPGNILSLQLEHEGITEVVEVIGERGLSAETVANKAVAQLNRYLDSPIVVGEHLADQLLLPMVIGGGGRFTTCEPSMHLLTNAEIIREFTRAQISISEIDEGRWRVSVSGKAFNDPSR